MDKKFKETKTNYTTRYKNSSIKKIVTVSKTDSNFIMFVMKYLKNITVH